MDSSQQETILRAIVISSSSTWSGQPIVTNDRNQAFSVLAEFRNYPNRIPVCLNWLPQPQLFVAGNECTVSAKLYACELVSEFLKKQYAKLEYTYIYIFHSCNTFIRHLNLCKAFEALSYVCHENVISLKLCKYVY